MIAGIVNRDREATVRLTVLGKPPRRQMIEAVIDTGFDDWLTLPRSIIDSLRLPWRNLGRAILADGSESVFNIYRGAVVWDRRRRRISIHEADSMPLVGMSLLADYELGVQVWPGGRVIITRRT